MEDKLVDTLYNTQLVLKRYRKLQTVPINKELVAFWNKVNNFYGITKIRSKKSQKNSATWQQDTTMEMMLQSGHLIYFRDMVVETRVVQNIPLRCSKVIKLS